MDYANAKMINAKTFYFSCLETKMMLHSNFLFPKPPISSGCVIAAYFKYHCSVSR